MYLNIYIRVCVPDLVKEPRPQDLAGRPGGLGKGWELSFGSGVSLQEGFGQRRVIPASPAAPKLPQSPDVGGSLQVETGNDGEGG